MSVTAKFIKAFDSQNQSHVKWLSRMIDVAEHMDALEWPHVHFCICAVYAKAVLRKKAHVPSV